MTANMEAVEMRLLSPSWNNDLSAISCTKDTWTFYSFKQTFTIAISTRISTVQRELARVRTELPRLLCERHKSACCPVCKVLGHSFPQKRTVQKNDPRLRGQ